MLTIHVHPHRVPRHTPTPATLPSSLSDPQLEEICRRHHHPKRGPRSQLRFPKLLRALVAHTVMTAGTLERHVEEITGRRQAASTVSERRQALPWVIFEEILRLGLRPLADPTRHPGAFYHGLRLLTQDGTSVPVYSTPDAQRRWKKSKTRQGRAAFARIPVVVLAELGLHNPIAVQIGRQQESEYNLAWDLVAQIPPGSLTINDRLSGCGAFAARLMQRWTEVGSHFLVRARKGIGRRRVQRLRDGSCIVELSAVDETGERFSFPVREIRGQILRHGKRPVAVRFWTSLRDEREYPALELLALYARRWEIEITIKELKQTLLGTDLLQAHTQETALQEVAALVLAQAAVAEVRSQAAHAAEVEVLAVSHEQALRWVSWLWMSWPMLRTTAQRRAAIQRALQQIVLRTRGKRRQRSCPRGLRQPVSSWPRIQRRTCWKGEVQYRVLHFGNP
jgi:hypothetical protein